MTERHAMLAYRIDAEDRLCEFGAAWDAFASENDAPEVSADGLLGRSLWDYIADVSTAQIYRDLCDRVRRTGETIRFPFRCDAPTLRRFMQMVMRPHEDGGIAFETVVVRTEQRAAADLLDRRQPRSDQLLEMCSFCRRAFLAPTGWIDVERLIEELRLFDHPVLPQITHGVCSRCEPELRRRLMR